MIFSSLLLGGSQWRVSITKHLDSDDIKYTSYGVKATNVYVVEGLLLINSPVYNLLLVVCLTAAEVLRIISSLFW